MLETPEPKSQTPGDNLPGKNLSRVRRTFGNFYWPYLVAVLVYIADQVSKYSIEQMLGPIVGSKTAPIFGGLIFEYVKNRGASYNFLVNMPWLFTIIALAVAIGIIIYYQTQGVAGFWYRLGLGLILGGIVGNLSDRLFKDGYVTDFIHITWLKFFNVFNLADSAITVGVTVIIVASLFQAFGSQKSALDDETNGKAE